MIRKAFFLGNRSGGRCIRKQGRSRPVPIGSLTGSGNVVEQVTLLLLEGSGDGHDAFGKAAASLALGSEAYFPPAYPMAYLSFGQIVGGVYAGHMDAGPQGRLSFEEVPAVLACAQVVPWRSNWTT